MSKLLNQKKTNIHILYNNILTLSRNKLFYIKFDLADTFQNRINLIFFHISFIFVKINQYKEKILFKKFHQKLFDLLFEQIESNMRELGFGDVTVNKNMKYLVKSFYNILLFSQEYCNKKIEYKRGFFDKCLKYNTREVKVNSDILIKYFDDFQTFCFDLGSDSVLKGELKFKFN